MSILLLSYNASLPISLNIIQIYYSLRQCYIRFIRKVYDKKGAEGQEETTKAFEFMLNYIGIASLQMFGSISFF